jgi:pimeloyl-ACP methyl ester carboxylesterase
MKLALLLPGYIESPDYHHLVVIDKKLQSLGYASVRVDACNLWQTGNCSTYTTTNYITQVNDIMNSYQNRGLEEVVLIGHSLGVLVALVVGNTNNLVSKIICLSPPNPLQQSDSKWINGVRTSKKDLPQDPTIFREFSVPISFVPDRDQYSFIDSLKNFQKPLQIIIGDQDPSFESIKKVATDLNLPNFVTKTGMGHDFRQSDDLCQSVASDIVTFLND